MIVKPMLHYVYKITFEGSPKEYIGITSCVVHRLAAHRSARRLPFETGYSVEVLACSTDRAGALEAEEHLIGFHDTLEPNGFNILKGRRYTAAVKAKISAGNLGNQKWLGRKHSDETRAKMSLQKQTLAHCGLWPTGRVVSQETRDKIAKANKGQKAWNRGVPRTAEEKAKMSASLKGRKSPMEGKSWSPEMRAKISASVKGFKHTEETKKKMREGAAERARKSWETRRANAARVAKPQ